MERTFQIFLFLHLIGVFLWVGGMFEVARLLRFRDVESDATFRGKLAQKARRVAILPDVGMTLALVGGVYMLLAHDRLLLKQPYMHVKLTLAAAAIGLQVFWRVKAKRAATGAGGEFPRALFPVLGLVVVAILAVVVFKVPSAR